MQYLYAKLIICHYIWYVFCFKTCEASSAWCFLFVFVYFKTHESGNKVALLLQDYSYMYIGNRFIGVHC